MQNATPQDYSKQLKRSDLTLERNAQATETRMMLKDLCKKMLCTREVSTISKKMPKYAVKLGFDSG